MVGVGIMVALASISTIVAIVLMVRDMVKNVTYEVIEIDENDPDSDEYLFEEDEEEEVNEKVCHLTLINSNDVKSNVSRYNYEYNKEVVLERPKLEMVSGYSKKRKK